MSWKDPKTTAVFLTVVNLSCFLYGYFEFTLLSFSAYLCLVWAVGIIVNKQIDPEYQ